MIARVTMALLAALALAACTAPPELVVATWNIHHARGLDEKVDVDRIAAELRATGADLVALQEVDVGVARSGKLDIPAELARRLGMYAVFGKNIDYQGGDYGNALLSRWPIAESRNHHYRMLRAGEQRGVLVVRIDAPLGSVTAMVTHIDYRPDDSERWQNTAELRALAREEAADATAVILCGDFNDEPKSRVHKALSEDFTDAWQALEEEPGPTYPAEGPRKRIDWVLLHRGSAKLRPTAVSVPATRASDHRAVVIRFAPP